MKKIYFAILIFLNTTIYAQVTVTGSTNSDGTFPKLKAAFDQLNKLDTIQTGKNIVITVTGTITEDTSAVLNAAYAPWNSLTIKPSGVAMITGNINGALISLSGADSVTIDGLNLPGYQLTIENTSTASGGSCSAIRLTGDASYNTITNCTINGSAKGSPSVLSATIYIATSSGAGNDYNMISNCDIGAAGSNLPTKAIFAKGTSNQPNGHNTISNCKLHDYFANGDSYGIYISTGNTDMTISGNTLYQSAPRQHTINLSSHIVIGIENTSGNFEVLDNQIGSVDYEYSVSGGVSSDFYGISLSVATASVQGNKFLNINQSTTSAGTGQNAPCIMIYGVNGVMNIGDIKGNEIGDLSGATKIQFATSAIGDAGVYGIYYNDNSNNVLIANNKIGALLGSSSGKGGTIITGIGVNTGLNQSAIIRNNIIGGTGFQGTIGNTFSPQPGGRVIGISAGGRRNTIEDNIVRNLVCASQNTGTAANASVIGIYNSSGSQSPVKISGNKIYALVNYALDSAVSVIGIYYTSSASATQNVSENFIHSFNLNSAIESSSLIGIYANGGSTRYFNNMIRLGINENGNSLTNDVAVTGILNNVGTNSFYFNSVYIGGADVVGAAGGSAAMEGRVTATNRTYQNNIFYNTRANIISGSNTAKHYAIKLSDVSALPAGLTLNNNDYSVPGTAGEVLGSYGGIDVTSLAAWKTATGLDSSSYDVDPMFANATGDSASVNLHINSGATPTLLESGGAAISGINTDIDGDVRPGPGGSVNGGGIRPDIGADEFDGVLLPVGVSAINSTTSFPLYPNPSEGIVHFTFSKIAEVRITDVNGKLVYSGEAATGTNQLDMTHLPAGVYQLQIGNTSEKLLIAR